MLCWTVLGVKSEAKVPHGLDLFSCELLTNHYNCFFQTATAGADQDDLDDIEE